MASKDSKMRQVYEALETKNYKNALKKSQNFLQAAKDPKEIISFRVLKALVLERMGKGEEALEECTLVEKEVPTDEWVLSTLYQVLRNQKRLDRATAAYENALKKDPSNESLLQSIFFSYAREFRYKEQQDAAMKLIKSFSKPKYYYFATASMIQQVPLDSTNHILLTLAQRMVDKIKSENNIKSMEEVLFCLHLFERVQAFDKSLEYLTQFESLFKNKTDYLEEKAHVLKKLENKSEFKVVARDLLFLNFENWDYYMQYLDCFFPMENNDERNVNIQEIEETLTLLKEKVDPRDRNFPLATIDFKFRLYSTFSEEKYLSEFFEEMKSYLKVFGDKFSCSRDILYYFNLLPAVCHDQFIQIISEHTQSSPLPFSSEGTTDEENIRHVNQFNVNEKLRTKVGLFQSETVEQKLQRIDNYYSIYLKALELPAASKLEESDRQFGDDLLLLAAHIYIDLWLQTKEVKYLNFSVEIMEIGLNRSKYNFNFKLLVVRLYCLLGAIKPAMEIYKSLSIKYLQIDTTSFFILDDAIKLHSNAEKKKLFESINKFYNDTEKELPELITFPYRYGSYSKIKEFIEFKEKLMKTQQRTIFSIESIYSQLYTIQPPVTYPLISSLLQKQLQTLSLTEEKIAQLVDTSDNSAWDNIHPLSDVCYPTFYSCADVSLSAEAKKSFIYFRYLLLQYLLHFLEGDLEKLQTLHPLILELSLRLFSSDSENLNTQIWRTSLQSLQYCFKLCCLENEFQDKPSLIPFEQYVELQNLMETALADNEKLWGVVKSYFVPFEGKNMPILTSYLTNCLIFNQIQIQIVNKNFPNRCKKSAKAELKDLHKNLKPTVKALTSFYNNRLSEFSAECSRNKTEVAKIEFPSTKLDAKTAEYVREKIRLSYTASLMDIATLSSSYSSLKL